MTKFLATTALVLITSAPAFAQTNPSIFLEGVDNGVRASDFVGKRVYVTDADTTGLSKTPLATADTNWKDAGEISDLMISLSGDTEAVLVDFGGFLGIGEKTVALDMRQLALVPDADSPDDYFIVFKGTSAELEAAKAFNPDMVFAATAADTAVVADTTTTAPAAEGTSMAAGNMIDFTTMTEADLVGKRVYGVNNEDVGEISAVSLTADGKIAGAVVDVGGFLGMGEKPVVLTADALTMVQDGDTVKFVVSATQAQLEAMQTYVN